MTIGEKIRKYRKEKGLTQQELAQITNIPINTLQRYERDEVEAPIKRVVTIAHALGVYPLAILTDTQQEPFDKVSPLANELLALNSLFSGLMSLYKYNASPEVNDDFMILKGHDKKFYKLSFDEMAVILENVRSYYYFMLSQKGTPEK